MHRVRSPKEFINGVYSQKLSKNIIGPPLEPVVMSLLEKLNDGASRVRDTALKSLMNIAACSSIGPALVGSRALIPLQGKLRSLPRPLVGRLQVLSGIVSSYGLGNSSNLSGETILNYCKNVGAFNHSNGEVRDACKELTIALQSIIGSEPIEPYLSVLRPKQIEEYMAAFEKNGCEIKKIRSDERPTVKQEKSNRDNATTHSKATPRGQSQEVKKEERQEVSDFSTCMFCGKVDKRWDEDALDLHYWKDCPLLFPCPACAQVRLVSITASGDNCCAHRSLKSLGCPST